MKENNLELNIEKIANAVLFMLEGKVLHLNDKKLSILLFLIDYKHQELFDKKIFGEVYIKEKRNPEPKTLTDIFDVIANNEDLDMDDERLYIIQEFLAYVDVEVVKKDKYIELKFIKEEEDFDKSLFSKDELKTISQITKLYKVATTRHIANKCFNIQKVRETISGEIII